MRKTFPCSSTIPRTTGTDTSSSRNNSRILTPKALAIACNLGCYWSKRDFETCQKIQKLAFPNGVIWDKEKRNYLTTEVNQFFDLIGCISDDYKMEIAQKKDKPFDLSSLVAGGGLEPPTFGL